MQAKEIKALTGAKSKMEGINILYAALEKKQWTRNNRTYTVAGYDYRKDHVHFTCTWSVEGGAGHSRVEIPLADAVSSKNGDLCLANVLH